MRLIYRLTTCLLFLLALGATTVQARSNKQTTVYVFGFAASFNDSTVYFTSIQKIDSAWTESKTHFLYSRENYSYQLRDYLKEHGMKAPTCVTTFALKQKDIEKKYLKFTKKYTTGKTKYNVKYLTETDFKYSPVQVDINAVEQQKKEADAEKKARKEAKKQLKQKGSRQGGPRGGGSGGHPGGEPGGATEGETSGM